MSKMTEDRKQKRGRLTEKTLQTYRIRTKNLNSNVLTEQNAKAVNGSPITEAPKFRRVKKLAEEHKKQMHSIDESRDKVVDSLLSLYHGGKGWYSRQFNAESDARSSQVHAGASANHAITHMDWDSSENDMQSPNKMSAGHHKGFDGSPDGVLEEGHCGETQHSHESVKLINSSSSMQYGRIKPCVGLTKQNSLSSIAEKADVIMPLADNAAFRECVVEIPATQSDGDAKKINTTVKQSLGKTTRKKDAKKLYMGKKMPSTTLVTQQCQDIYLRIISTDIFAALSSILNKGSPAASVETTLQVKPTTVTPASLNLQLIRLRLSTGAYGETPELFSADIQQVWQNIISTGNELITLASSLSKLSTNLYEQQVLSLFQTSALEDFPTGSREVLNKMGPLDSQQVNQSIQYDVDPVKKLPGSNGQSCKLSLDDSHRYKVYPVDKTDSKCEIKPVESGGKLDNLSENGYSSENPKIHSVKHYYRKGRNKDKKDSTPTTIKKLDGNTCQWCSNDCGTDYIVCSFCGSCFHKHCTQPASCVHFKNQSCCASCILKKDKEKPATDVSGEKSQHFTITGTVCEVCKKEDQNVTFCDVCHSAFHVNCLNPTFDQLVYGRWCCLRSAERHLELMVDNSSRSDKNRKSSLLATDNGSIDYLKDNDKSSGYSRLAICVGDDVENEVPESTLILLDKNYCKLCKTTSRKPAAVCSGCRKRYHLSCLKPPLNRVPRGVWYCPSCLCRICQVDADDDKILLCDACDEGYHTYCLNPPLMTIPDGAWFCASCTKANNTVSNKSEVSKRKRKSTDPKRSI